MRGIAGSGREREINVRVERGRGKRGKKSNQEGFLATRKPKMSFELSGVKKARYEERT